MLRKLLDNLRGQSGGSSSDQDGDEIRFGDIEWLSDTTFKTPNFVFNCSLTDFRAKTTKERIVFLKTKEFLALYDDLITQDTTNVFELGFFRAGMPLMLADTKPIKKIVAIDFRPPTKIILDHIKRAKLRSRVKLYGNVDQGDRVALRNVLDKEFGDQPLDLIMDDCSHEYPQTKASFEATFGYLKPGGKFVIEDWGWAHWLGDHWQSDKSQYHGKPAMTNILFEIIMAHASNPGIISKIEIVNPAFAVITRGPDLPYKEEFKLSSIYKTAGRTFSVL